MSPNLPTLSPRTLLSIHSTLWQYLDAASARSRAACVVVRLSPPAQWLRDAWPFRIDCPPLAQHGEGNCSPAANPQIDRLADGLATAGKSRTCRRFTVYRTLFDEPSGVWLANKIDSETPIERARTRFEALIGLWGESLYRRFAPLASKLSFRRARNASRNAATGRVLYRTPNVVERFFTRIKHFRRISTRYDKPADSSGVRIFCLCVWATRENVNRAKWRLRRARC